MRHPKVDYRNDLPRFFNEFNFKTGAEIGVKEGGFSLKLCQGIPNLKLYCIDAWHRYPGSKERRDEVQEDRYNLCVERLVKPYGAELIKKLSMDAVKDFEDESLDFVYIDANHKFDYVMSDIIEWSKKVRKGGIVAGHDYYVFTNAGVIQAVDTYTKAHNITEVYFTLDPETSWFWWRQ